MNGLVEGWGRDNDQPLSNRLLKTALLALRLWYLVDFGLLLLFALFIHLFVLHLFLLLLVARGTRFGLANNFKIWHTTLAGICSYKVGIHLLLNSDALAFGFEEFSEVIAAFLRRVRYITAAIFLGGRGLLSSCQGFRISG